MKEKGILKGGNRQEKNWSRVKFGEPFKKSLDVFRDEVLKRSDFDPTALLQFGLFMSMSVINILKECESSFGIEGQRVVNNALIKTGYDVGKQIIENVEIPPDFSPIELISYLVTIVNTQAWTSIEEPEIESEEKCTFNILWCPLQDTYKAFDCRVQRYLVQGIIDAFRDISHFNIEYQVEFTQTIPAGAKYCRFIIEQKRKGDQDKWKDYTSILEQKALKRMGERKKNLRSS